MSGQHLSSPQLHDILAALAELGMLKPGEDARVLHAHGCRFREDTCTCPGGAELLFSDWDEPTPTRYQSTPERFYAQH